MSLELLDETGFMFLDNNNRPYHVRMWGGMPWLFYWHVEGHWTSLRQLNQSEVWSFEQCRMTEAHEEYYRLKQEKWELGLSLGGE